ncbi:MAG: helix-turn-helix transcriptional regulator [bacterium]
MKKGGQKKKKTAKGPAKGGHLKAVALPKQHGLVPGTRFICKIVRQEMGMTQTEMASLLGVSKKAIQSYEQRWRSTPVNIERLALLYLGCLRLSLKGSNLQCWKETGCSRENREKCIAWKLKRGDICWMFTGTYCEGKKEGNWKQKFNMCRKCPVLTRVFE